MLIFLQSMKLDENKVIARTFMQVLFESLTKTLD